MSTTLDDVIKGISAVLKAIDPVVSLALPAAGPAIAIAVAILQGFLAGEPVAVALYNQIIGGTPVTPEQLAVYISANNLANAQADADIAAALANIAAANP